MIYAGSLDGTASVRVQSPFSNALYTAPAASGQPGYLVFRRENILMAQEFDAEKLRTTGEMFAVAEPVGEAGNIGFGAFSISGRILAHGPGGVGDIRESVWVDRKGKPLERLTKPGRTRSFVLSPDARRVIFDGGDLTDFWLHDLTRGTSSRFTFGAGNVTSAIWSPDGKSVVFGSAPASSFSYDLYRKPASGAVKEVLPAHAGVNAFPDHWAPDGKSIVYSALSDKTNIDLWIVPVDGSGHASGAGAKPVVYLQTPFRESRTVLPGRTVDGIRIE